MKLFNPLFLFLFLCINSIQSQIKQDSSVLIVNVSKVLNEATLNITLNKRISIRGTSNYLRPYRYVFLEDKPVKFSMILQFPGIKGIILPSDTLDIFVERIQNTRDVFVSGKSRKISFDTYSYIFKGKSAQFFNYYYSLENDSNYIKIDRYFKSSPKDLTSVLAKIDTTTRFILKYLQSYHNNNPLPEWFIQSETKQIVYDDALQKLKAISLYNLNYPKKVFLTPEYLVWIMEVPIDNPSALDVDGYFEFLQIYFSLLNGGWQQSGVSSRVFSHFLKTLPDVRKQLKSEVYEQYMAYNIREYYKNSTFKQPLDSLMKSLKPTFKNIALYNTLINNDTTSN